ncbi:MAG: class I SAM-dependent methyltransferase [Ignavibacteriales bacterium]|nr:class I SAM-dependent methyltransferase [Ignavibacteriales bacterium]
MKNLIKKFLQHIGFIDKARMIYNSAKSISPEVLTNEIKFRKNGLPDGYPAPPPKLIFLIIALRWSSVYYNSGKLIFDDLLKVLDKNKIELEKLNRVLDFGCGCGRIIRHFHHHSKHFELFGSDYNPLLIKWCSANLTFGNFSVNKLAPPLNYENIFFDFVYARSVFTHLGFDLQKEWMKEFERIIKPGGFLYLTTHGENLYNNLTPEQLNSLQQNGILTINDDIEGDNKCTTYQTKKFIEENLLSCFKIVDFIPGKYEQNLTQDIYLMVRL